MILSMTRSARGQRRGVATGRHPLPLSKAWRRILNSHGRESRQTASRQTNFTMAGKRTQLVDLKHIAERLTVSVSVLRKLPEYKSLKLRVVRVGRKWRWTEHDAEAFVSQFVARKMQADQQAKEAEDKAQQLKKAKEFERATRRAALKSQTVVPLAEYSQQREAVA